MLCVLKKNRRVFLALPSSSSVPSIIFESNKIFLKVSAKLLIFCEFNGTVNDFRESVLAADTQWFE